MSIFQALLSPFQSWRSVRTLLTLTFGLMIPYINLILIINRLLSEIRFMQNDGDEHPGISLNHKDALTVIAGWGLAWLIPVLALSKMLAPYHRTHDTSLFFLCIVLISLAFGVGLMRYAVAGNPYAFIQIPGNLVLVWQHKLAAMRFVLNSIFYVILSFLLVSFVGQKLLEFVLGGKSALVGLLLTFIYLACLVDGLGFFLGQWVQTLAIDEPEQSTAKRKNDVLFASGKQKVGEGR